MISVKTGNETCKMPSEGYGLHKWFEQDQKNVQDVGRSSHPKTQRTTKNTCMTSKSNRGDSEIKF